MATATAIMSRRAALLAAVLLVAAPASGVRLPDPLSAAGIAPKQLPLPTPLLQGTSLDPQSVELVRCFKASVDGWSAGAFHSCVDNKGSGLVVARARSGATLGGFNPLGWRSSDDYGQSMAAFLFVDDGGGGWRKAPVFPGGDACLFDYASSGPCFGAADLVIGRGQAAVMGGITGPGTEDILSAGGDLRQASSAPGTAYERIIGWPSGALRLVELEVYVSEKAAERARGSSQAAPAWWPF